MAASLFCHAELRAAGTGTHTALGPKTAAEGASNGAQVTELLLERLLP